MHGPGDVPGAGGLYVQGAFNILIKGYRMDTRDVHSVYQKWKLFKGYLLPKEP
jgi:hypothetical protein